MPSLVRLLLLPQPEPLTELSDMCIHCHQPNISNGMSKRHLSFTLSEQNSWFTFLNVNSSHFFPISQKMAPPFTQLFKSFKLLFKLLSLLKVIPNFSFLYPHITSMSCQNIPHFLHLPCCHLSSSQLFPFNYCHSFPSGIPVSPITLHFFPTFDY